jgi:hypothetical protein
LVLFSSDIRSQDPGVVFFFFLTWFLGKERIIIHSQEKIAENHSKVFSQEHVGRFEVDAADCKTVYLAIRLGVCDHFLLVKDLKNKLFFHGCGARIRRLVNEFLLRPL